MPRPQRVPRPQRGSPHPDVPARISQPWLGSSRDGHGWHRRPGQQHGPSCRGCAHRPAPAATAAPRPTPGEAGIRGEAGRDRSLPARLREAGGTRPARDRAVWKKREKEQTGTRRDSSPDPCTRGAGGAEPPQRGGRWSPARPRAPDPAPPGGPAAPTAPLPGSVREGAAGPAALQPLRRPGHVGPGGYL